MIYPWQQAAWHTLAEHWHKQPHAWLFTGKSGIGKRVFARRLAHALLCEQPTALHEPCGVCTACHLLAQGSHPDLQEITPEVVESDSGTRKLAQIKIDAVRALLDFIHLSSHRGGRRVVLIHPAERMNVQAANALLKVLEEPPPQAVFLLVTEQKDQLLPTIKSRCRQWALPAPSQAQALAYLHEHQVADAAELLAFHSGAPLFAAEPEQDQMREKLLPLLSVPRLMALLDYAAEFDRKKWPLALFLSWLDKWLLDIALQQQGLPPSFYPAFQAALGRLADELAPLAVFEFADRVRQLVPYGQHTLNVKLQIEAVLIDYLALSQAKKDA